MKYCRTHGIPAEFGSDDCDMCKAQNRIIQLEAALRKYGNHDVNCRITQPLSCNCGLCKADYTRTRR